MVHRKLALALVLIAAVMPVSAASADEGRSASAPAGTTETRYCMRVEAFTGSHIERVKCWTREKWTRQGVDVDRDWAKEGVRTIG